MADKSKIAWTSATWNCVVGCRRVAPGCSSCYAERLAATRLAKTPKYAGLAVMRDGDPRWTGVARIWPDALDQVVRWTRPRRVFTTSMGDLFYEGIPEADVDLVYAFMAISPQHQHQNLTKRGGRRREYLTRTPDRPFGIATGAEGRVLAIVKVLTEEWCWICRGLGDVRAEGCTCGTEPGGGEHSEDCGTSRCPLCCDDHTNEADALMRTKRVAKAARACLSAWRWPLPNVIEMVSCSEQASADDQIPHLLATACALRGVSYEPALGPVDFSRWVGVRPGTVADPWPTNGRNDRRIDWLIYGGESGPHARPGDLAWARSARDQCRATGIAFFMKQTGARPYDRECWRARPADRAGADPAEWPEDLCIREFPAWENQR